MKLCIDCKWYGGVAIATGRDVCKHPDNKHIDPVHGLDHNYDCQQLRERGHVRPGRQMVGEEMSALGTVNGDGYKTFWVNGQNRYEHRLVRERHFPPTQREWFFITSDENRLNNDISNLELDRPPNAPAAVPPKTID